VLLVAFMACASTSKQESTGEYVDDSVITTKVKALLAEDDFLKSFQISVETYKGTVQMSGFVDSQKAVDKAVEIARSVRQNEAMIQGGRKENAAVVQERAKRSKEGTVNREARIEPPKTTNYIVPANQVNRPKSEIALQQKEIKGSGRGVPPAQPAQVVVPQHVAPAQPEQPSQAAVPQHVAPARPGQTRQVVIPEHATPIKPGQKDRPGQVVVPQYAAPAQPKEGR
jgi:hypothetical protein